MADNTKIEWADATLNYVNGCTVVSPGCTNCYAMKLAGTRLKHHPSRAGLTADSKAGPVWTGEIRLNEAALEQALKWKRPRRIFWNAHGDLFHDAVPDAAIDRLFAVCALTPHHTHMILTKRSARMRERVSNMAVNGAPYWGEVLKGMLVKALGGATPPQWPLPNVWLGVSVEDQVRADMRIPDLLKTPAALHFVSAEPLLSSIDLRDIAIGNRRDGVRVDALTGYEWDGLGDRYGSGQRLGLVIVGGEGGPAARPLHPYGPRLLRDQCSETGVPFFFKQWGEYIAHPAPDAKWAKNGKPVPPELEPVRFERVGKKAAGRLLYGVEHNGLPEARP